MSVELPYREASASRRVVSAGVPGVAAADAPETAAGAANRAVLPHRLDEARTAIALNVAAASKHGALAKAVEEVLDHWTHLTPGNT